MGALDGFYSTWNKARETFGVGTPTDGSQHDGSSQLLKMKGMIDSAAQHDGWQGKGAEAYAAANKEHAAVYQKLAELDKKMSAEITNAANIVTNGRTQLDNTKSWVDSAVNALPSSLSAQARENSLIPIAKEGITQVNNTVSTANGDMLKVGFRLTELKNGFDELQNQKLGPGEKKDDAKGLTDKDGDGKPDQDDVHTRAEQDVQDALGGNKDAAARVEEVLNRINPGQTLNEEEGAYLSQMQAQQAGMSVNRLHEVKAELGEHGDILANSWQLMSNDDVKFPKTELSPEALDNPAELIQGDFDKLPHSVQEAINRAGTYDMAGETRTLEHLGDLHLISDIVKDGDQRLQTGTELDRGMIRAADTIMDRYDDIGTKYAAAEVTQKIFESSGRDHQIIHDHLVGSHGDNGLGSTKVDRDDFLRDLNRIPWPDDGKAAASLVSWTHESHDTKIAAETASSYATYIGEHGGELTKINGQTLGQLNPELVKGYAHGLTPFMSDIAGLSSIERHDGFGFVDQDHPVDRPIAKGLFSVLGTEENAYKEFNGVANAHLLSLSHGWAEDVKNHVPLSASDMRLTDCATLKALEAVGTTEAARALHLNADQVYERQKAAYGWGVELLSSGSSIVPWAGPLIATEIKYIGSGMQDSVIGIRPDLATETIDPMGREEASRFALNALIAHDVPLSGPKIDERWIEQIPINPDHPEGPKVEQIKSLSALQKIDVGQGTMEQYLAKVLTSTVTNDYDPTTAIKSRYDDVVRNPKPN